MDSFLMLFYYLFLFYLLCYFFFKLRLLLISRLHSLVSRVSFYFAFFLVCNSFVFKLRILTLSFLFVLSRFTSYCTVYRTRCHQQQRMMADQVATDFTIHHPSRRLCNTSKHIPQSQRSSKVGRSLFYVTHNN